VVERASERLEAELARRSGASIPDVDACASTPSWASPRGERGGADGARACAMPARRRAPLPSRAGRAALQLPNFFFLDSIPGDRNSLQGPVEAVDSRKIDLCCNRNRDLDENRSASGIEGSHQDRQQQVASNSRLPPTAEQRQ
jgi:hypothetical protein